MKNKKTIAITLMALSVVAAGCGKGSESGTGSTNSPAPTVDNTPLKLTIMANLSTPEVPSDKLEKLLEQKTNSDITFQWVPDGSYDEKFQAALATGSLPQAVYLKNQASFVLLRQTLKDGQFWEIGPYLKDYPNLKNLNPEVLENTKVMGKIYSLYQERPIARQGIIYRKDWADKLGLAEPKTTDDIYNMLKKFKEANLGGGKTIPLADRNDLIYGSFKTLSAYFGTPNGWGVTDGKLVPEFMTQGYMDTMNFIKKLRTEGLINQDFPVTSKNDQQNLMYTGRSGMYVGTMGDVKNMQDKTAPNFPNALYDVSNDLKGPDGNKTTWGTNGYGTILLFPKSSVKSEAELKGILGVFDKFFGKELADVMKFGLKDQNHYTVNEEGKIVSSTDTKLIEKEVRPYLNMALAETTNVSPVKYASPALEKANVLSNEAAKFMVTDPTASLDSATYAERGTRLQEQIKDATYQFIMNKIDEAGFKAATDKWLKDGGQKIVDEFNEQYAAINKK